MRHLINFFQAFPVTSICWTIVLICFILGTWKAVLVWLIVTIAVYVVEVWRKI